MLTLADVHEPRADVLAIGSVWERYIVEAVGFQLNEGAPSPATRSSSMEQATSAVISGRLPPSPPAYSVNVGEAPARQRSSPGIRISLILTVYRAKCYTRVFSVRNELTAGNVARRDPDGGGSSI